jgi:hypothetical protein
MNNPRSFQFTHGLALERTPQATDFSIVLFDADLSSIPGSTSEKPIGKPQLIVENPCSSLDFFCQFVCDYDL